MVVSKARTLFWLSSVLACVSLCFVGYKNSLSGELASEEAKLVGLLTEKKNARSAVVETARRLEAIVDVASAVQPPTPKSRSVQSPLRGPARATDLIAVFSEEPELYKTYLTNHRNQVELQYREFFVNNRLSKKEQDKFIEVMMRHRESMMNSDIASFKQGIPRGDPSTKVAAENLEHQRKAEFVELLGAEGWDNLRTFNHTVNERRSVDNLMLALYDGPAPLTHIQATETRRVLAKLFAKSEPVNGQYGTPSPADYASVINESSRFMSESQVRALQSLLARQEAAAALTRPTATK